MSLKFNFKTDKIIISLKQAVLSGAKLSARFDEQAQTNLCLFFLNTDQKFKFPNFFLNKVIQLKIGNKQQF